MIKTQSVLAFFSGLTILSSSVAVAFEVEHGAHVHGDAVMNIAIEGQKVSVELESPLFNIAGFEHKPETAQDKQHLQDSIAKLRSAEKLVIISPEAKCSTVDSHVQLGDSQESHSEEHADHGHHDEHKHHEEHSDHHHEHDHHEKHTDHHHDHDDHAKHTEHEHHKQHDHEEHQDIHAHYQFDCAEPEAIKTISFGFFKEFPELQSIKVNLITAKGALVKDINKADTEIQF